MGRIKLAKINPEQVADEIGDFIIAQVAGIGFTGAVIGQSGGVDSTIVAALAKRAFDKYNLTTQDKLELVSYMLPSNTNNPADTTDGLKVADQLGVRREIINLEPVVQAYRATNPETLESKFHKGNIMSEIRGTILHAKAAIERKLVLGTGNRDEDFGVGYYTLFGDGAVHLSPIGNLPKRLVRQMARYFGFAEIANRVPTAGLEPKQTDFGDLGYYYETVELVGRGLEQNLSMQEILDDCVLQKSTKRDLNDYRTKFGEKKFDNPKQIVEDILRRNRIAEVKGKIVHPPIAPLTLEYKIMSSKEWEASL
jgi:NAD+ synthase